MINSLEIINLPHDHSALTVWTEFRPDGKNMLFIWDNGVWKTTFLSALFQSLERRKEFQNGVIQGTNNVFASFAKHFDGNSWKITGDTDGDTEKELATDDELVIALEEAFSLYFSNNIDNLFHAKLPYVPEAQLSNLIAQYVQGAEDSQNDDKYGNVFLLPETREVFIESLRLYAKDHKIATNKVYSTVAMMMNDTYPSIDVPATSWWYIVPKGKNMVSIYSAKVITLLDSHGGKNKSLGLKTLETIDSIDSNKKQIIILDEPTNGLTSERARQIWSKVLEVRGSQVFSASHNEAFIRGAQNHENWKVVEIKRDNGKV